MSAQPTDFNDLHQLRGLRAVREQLLAALEAPDARSVASATDLAQATDQMSDDPPVDAYAEDVGGDGQYYPADEAWYWQMDVSQAGKLMPHAANLELILLNDPRWQGVLGYCEFSYRIVFRKAPPIASAPGAFELQDADIARMRVWVHREYPRMVPPARGELADAITTVAQANRFHPVREYLQALRWDGVPRLATWLQRVYSAAGPEAYLGAVGTKFLIGAVARVMQPGCKMDTMMILEGDQGINKSTSLKVLFGDWFSDAPIPLGDKDSYLLLQGVWGYELAELDALNKTESTTAKAFLSQAKDRFRPPYGTTLQDYPRQTVALGTTNQDEYLKDYSGNRRYWPVMAVGVDIDWLKAHRDQLWAEALVLFRDGATWWVDTGDEKLLFDDEQENRLQRDAWEEPIKEWLARQTVNEFTYADILTQALNIDVGHIQRAHQNRLAPIMKHLGWKKARRIIKDPNNPGASTKRHVYQRPACERPVQPEVDW